MSVCAAKMTTWSALGAPRRGWSSAVPCPGTKAFGGEGGALGVLGLLNTGRENYNQAEATLRFHPIKDGDLSVSYIWSRSRGDLNTLGDVFIPFEQPVILSNAYGVRPSDVPNRVVAWGTFHLP